MATLLAKSWLLRTLQRELENASNAYIPDDYGRKELDRASSKSNVTRYHGADGYRIKIDLLYQNAEIRCVQILKVGEQRRRMLFEEPPTEFLQLPGNSAHCLAVLSDGTHTINAQFSAEALRSFPASAQGESGLKVRGGFCQLHRFNIDICRSQSGIMTLMLLIQDFQYQGRADEPTIGRPLPIQSNERMKMVLDRALESLLQPLEAPLGQKTLAQQPQNDSHITEYQPSLHPQKPQDIYSQRVQPDQEGLPNHHVQKSRKPQSEVTQAHNAMLLQLLRGPTGPETAKALRIQPPLAGSPISTASEELASKDEIPRAIDETASDHHQTEQPAEDQEMGQEVQLAVTPTDTTSALIRRTIAEPTNAIKRHATGELHRPTSISEDASIYKGNFNFVSMLDMTVPIPPDQSRILDSLAAWHFPPPGSAQFKYKNAPIDIIKSLNSYVDKDGVLEDSGREKIDPQLHTAPSADEVIDAGLEADSRLPETAIDLSAVAISPSLHLTEEEESNSNGDASPYSWEDSSSPNSHSPRDPSRRLPDDSSEAGREAEFNEGDPLPTMTHAIECNAELLDNEKQMEKSSLCLDDSEVEIEEQEQRQDSEDEPGLSVHHDQSCAPGTLPSPPSAQPLLSVKDLEQSSTRIVAAPSELVTSKLLEKATPIKTQISQTSDPTGHYLDGSVISSSPPPPCWQGRGLDIETPNVGTKRKASVLHSFSDGPSPAKRQYREEIRAEHECEDPAARSRRNKLAFIQAYRDKKSSNVIDQNPRQIFELFKVQYPHYRGDREHFFGICHVIGNLRNSTQEIKMSFWDDFIIRHKEDLLEYTFNGQRHGNGNVFQPYNQYYQKTYSTPANNSGILDENRLRTVLDNEMNLARVGYISSELGQQDVDSGPVSSNLDSSSTPLTSPEPQVQGVAQDSGLPKDDRLVQLTQQLSTHSTNTSLSLEPRQYWQHNDTPMRKFAQEYAKLGSLRDRNNAQVEIGDSGGRPVKVDVLKWSL